MGRGALRTTKPRVYDCVLWGTDVLVPHTCLCITALHQRSLFHDDASASRNGGWGVCGDPPHLKIAPQGGRGGTEDRRGRREEGLKHWAFVLGPHTMGREMGCEAARTENFSNQFSPPTRLKMTSALRGVVLSHKCWGTPDPPPPPPRHPRPVGGCERAPARQPRRGSLCAMRFLCVHSHFDVPRCGWRCPV